MFSVIYFGDYYIEDILIISVVRNVVKIDDKMREKVETRVANIVQRHVVKCRVSEEGRDESRADIRWGILDNGLESISNLVEEKHLLTVAIGLLGVRDDYMLNAGLVFLTRPRVMEQLVTNEYFWNTLGLDQGNAIPNEEDLAGMSERDVLFYNFLRRVEFFLQAKEMALDCEVNGVVSRVIPQADFFLGQLRSTHIERLRRAAVADDMKGTLIREVYGV